MDWSGITLRLRKRYLVFREERFFGAMALGLRAWAQLPGCVLHNGDGRALEKARLCLRLIPRHTMVSPPLLFALHDVVTRTLRAGTPGAIVECGVWNGGSAALMAAAAHSLGQEREVWLFDSFQGLPEPTEQDAVEVREFYYPGWNLGDEARVYEAWKKLGLAPDRLHIQRGWFKETLAIAPIEQISVLHLDCDWYEPVRLCLETFWERLSPGGIVVLNDYGLYDGANRATDEFLARQGGQIDLRSLGPVGAWFTKPTQPRKPGALLRAPGRGPSG